MILIPSLEILSGKLVRLVGGADSDPIVLDTKPLRAAHAMRRAGALFFHVVDLDAVFGQGDNNEVLAELASDMIPFQTRGGIETVERADELLALGADRVVLGSLPFTDGDAARELVERFGTRIAATLDVKGEEVLVRDQGSESGMDLAAALPLLRATGVEHLIYNSVEFAGEDGQLDFAKIRSILSEQTFQLYLRCTVHADEEIEPLLGLAEEGLLGVVLNHALAAETLPFAAVADRA